MKEDVGLQRKIGRSVRSSFGGNTRVFGFLDESGEYECDIIVGFDFPDRGVNSYGSSGLHRSMQKLGNQELHVEILAACQSQTQHVDNMVASCVFESLKNGTPIFYGSCIQNMVEQYNVSRTMSHVAFVSPFIWDGMNKMIVDGITVYFLLMLPISDAEKSVLDAQGIDALEAMFERAQINIYDINRPSVA